MVVDPDGVSKKLLLISGTASIAPAILKMATTSRYKITATFRNTSPDSLSNQIDWKHLDLSDLRSTEAFLEQIELTKFDRIIVLTGALSHKNFFEMSFEEMQKVYVSNVIGISYLLGKLIPRLQEISSVVILSSKSANSTSYDVCYSGAKAALQATIRSIAQFLNPTQSIIAIAPSAIENSAMFIAMDSAIQAKHLARSMDQLLTTQEVAEAVWDAGSETSINMSGKVIAIGRDIL